MTETVLVTGGTGFVAGWCIAELLNRGFQVRTTVRSLSREAAVRAAVSVVTDPGESLSVVVADLTSDEGWAAAMAGCDYVLHVASPLGTEGPRDAEALVVPARDGTVRVLRAAAAEGVRRVVMTSAAAAASPALYTAGGVTDESLWTDPEDPRLTSYRRSKTLAELAAWQFMDEYDGPMTLATILPGAVFGPILSSENLGSVQVIGRLLRGRMPGTPHLGFEIVDVRDLADAHIRAMTTEEAGGQRFLVVGEFLWMADMARELRAALGDAAHRVPTRSIPDILVRLLSLADPGLRAVVPGLGRTHRHSTAKARRLLGWNPRPAVTTVVECGRSLLDTNAL